MTVRDWVPVERNGGRVDARARAPLDENPGSCIVRAARNDRTKPFGRELASFQPQNKRFREPEGPFSTVAPIHYLPAVTVTPFGLHAIDHTLTVSPHLLALVVERRTFAHVTKSVVHAARAAVLFVHVRGTMGRVSGTMFRQVAIVVGRPAQRPGLQQLRTKNNG